MYTSFRKPAATKTVTFAVNYGDGPPSTPPRPTPPPPQPPTSPATHGDGRTAYLWLDGHNPADDHRVGAIAKERQEQGSLPEGVIASVKRVR